MRVRLARRTLGRESDALMLLDLPAVPEPSVPGLRLREIRAGRRAAPRSRQAGRRVDPFSPYGVPLS